MSKKYQKLHEEWSVSNEAMDFEVWLDQRRDERKAGKVKKDNGYNVNLVQALQQCAKWFGEYADIHAGKANVEKAMVNASKQTYCLNAIENAGKTHDYTPHPWSEPVPAPGKYLVFVTKTKEWVEFMLSGPDEQDHTRGFSHWMHMPPVPGVTK